MIDTLYDQARRGDIAVAGFYCDFLSQQEQTITNTLGAIIKQLVGEGDIPEHLREAFKESKKRHGSGASRLPELMGLLRITIASLPQVFICIDALDEYLPEGLPELLESLRDVVRESPNTRIFLTGRPHVGEAVRIYFTQAVLIPISPNTVDIRNYLEKRVDRDVDPEAMTKDLRAEIVGTIQATMSDMCVRPF